MISAGYNGANRLGHTHRRRRPDGTPSQLASGCRSLQQPRFEGLAPSCDAPLCTCVLRPEFMFQGAGFRALGLEVENYAVGLMAQGSGLKKNRARCLGLKN